MTTDFFSLSLWLPSFLSLGWIDSSTDWCAKDKLDAVQKREIRHSERAKKEEKKGRSTPKNEARFCSFLSRAD
jgi:hypothetical protein